MSRRNRLKRPSILLPRRWKRTTRTPTDVVLIAAGVLVGDGTVVAPGAIAVRGGRIADVGDPTSMCVAHKDLRVEDLGEALLAPGLVDVHCHLEWALTGGLAKGGEFGAWLEEFLRAAGTLSPEALATSANIGAVTALIAGTTTLWDSGPTGAGAAAMERVGIGGYCSLEIFGTGDAVSVPQSIARFVDARARMASSSGSGVIVGISPHAPYSVGPALWGHLMNDPEYHQMPWSTHLAESAAEIHAVAEGTGTIARALATRNARPGHWPALTPMTVIERIAAAGALRSGMIAAHCVALGANDPHLLASAGVAVAHCPTSNAYLGCGVAPLAALHAAGVRVGIGSDSPASAGNYDLRAEARAARLVHGAAGHPISAARALQMATRDGAQAMGLSDSVGMLTVGLRANMVAVAPAVHVAGGDPHLAFLDAASVVDSVWIDGARKVQSGALCDPSLVNITTQIAKARREVC